MRNHHETTPDRAGLAIGAGGIMIGTVAAALAAMGAPVGPLTLLAAFVGGSLVAALGITAVAIPFWAVLHVVGRRDIVGAALTGAVTSFFVFLFAQTDGFGLYQARPSDAETLLLRWISAAATCALLALIGAATGAIMWRIAYRVR